MLPLIAGVVLLILSIILGIYNRNKSNYTVYLFSFYMITSMMVIVYYILFSGKMHEFIPYVYIYFDPLFFLQGVFVYFYIKSNLDQENILQQRRNYLHFLPMLIPFLGNLSYFWLSNAEKLNYIAIFSDDPNKLFSLAIPKVFFNKIESYYARSFSLLIYSTVSIYYLASRRPFLELETNHKERRAKKYHLIFMWILSIIQWMLGLALLYGFFLAYMEPKIGRGDSFYYTRFFVEANLIVQILSLLLFPNILYGLKPKEKKLDKSKAISMNQTDDIPLEIIQNAEKIEEFMMSEKPYLSPKFKKIELSIQLNLSIKEIDDVFDFALRQSFTSYKNTLRINYAKNLLSNGEAEKITMDGIGFSSGFASRSSFYSTFKAETGLTPNQYIEQLKK